MSKLTEKLRKIYPELEEQIQREEGNRQVAVVADLWPLLGGWVRPITPRIRTMLELAGSPFLGNRRPMSSDVFLFLWLVSPHWVPEGRLSLIRTPSAWMHRLRLRVLSKLCNLWVWEDEIRKFVADQFQDSPGARQAKEDDEGPRVYHGVSGAAFCMREYGMSWQQYQDTPVMVLNQLYRVYQHNHGFGKPLNESDAMAARLIENEGRK